MDKPLLLLDVDGVLNPFRAAPAPNGYQQYELAGYRVFLAERHGKWLRQLADRVEMVWATTWCDDANELIGPILGLPQLPVIQVDTSRLEERNCPPTWKLPDISSFVGERPVIWLDDDLKADAYAWAAARSAPTLLIQPIPGTGFTRAHLRRIEFFIDRLEHLSIADESEDSPSQPRLAPAVKPLDSEGLAASPRSLAGPVPRS